MTRTHFKTALAASAAAMALVPLASASAQLAVPAAPVPAPAFAATSGAGAEVAAFYQRFPQTRIWFKSGADDPAIARLIEILQRSPFDGLQNGLELANAVQVAQTRARSRRSDRTRRGRARLVAGVGRLCPADRSRRPGMIYEVPVSGAAGHGRADQILLTAARCRRWPCTSTTSRHRTCFTPSFATPLMSRPS